MASAAKRQRKLSEEITIYYAPQKLVKARIKMMKTAMLKMGHNVVDSLSNSVTHLVSGFDYEDDVWKNIGLKEQTGLDKERIAIVSPAWHADSIREGELLSSQTYLLPKREDPKLNTEDNQTDEDDDGRIDDKYACQRATPLNHFNKRLSDIFEMLEEAANYRGDSNEYSRALAFRRCSCVLKSLPYKLKSLRQIKDKKDIGAHCQRVIKEFLSEGSSSEADQLESDEWFRCMRLFNGIFGVGPTTGNRWYRDGHRTIKDVIADPAVGQSQDTKLCMGLAYHADLSLPVTLVEAKAWHELILHECQRILPGTTVEITGGFRRGKPRGHDIDLLISHPQQGRERGILTKLLRRMEQLGLVVYGWPQGNTFTEEVLQRDTKHTPLRSTLDHFEMWLGVVRTNDKLTAASDPTSTVEAGVASGQGDSKADPIERCYRFLPESLQKRAKDILHAPPTTDAEHLPVPGMSEASDSLDLPSGPPPTPAKKMTVTSAVSSASAECSNRDWVARRVDLTVVPADQYYYALVGWTGSKQFNRSVRHYALKRHKLRLSSHGLWDYRGNHRIPANSEEEVFKNLHLTYRKPEERNC